MRQIKFVTASLALIAASAIAVAAVRPAALFGQEGEDMMPKPAKQHEMLMESVGNWSGTITMHTQYPGMSNEPVAATEKIEAFGDFWTVSHFNCEFMGMPFEGMGTMGFDPMKQKYIGTWQDNMSPLLMVMEGEMDEESGKLTMHYEGPDPMSGELVPHTNVMTMGENSYKLDFYMGEGDSATHTMTIDMKRKSSEKK